VSAAPSFTCAGCGAGLFARVPRASTSDAVDRWFASHGWDATSGRPLCPACKAAPKAPEPPPPPAPVVEPVTPAAPPSIAGVLEQAERSGGRGGRYKATPAGNLVHITWTGDHTGRNAETDALAAAVRLLKAAGYEALRVPGLPLVRVRGVAAVIGADEPGINHEHGRDDEQTFAMAAE
jgi:hypothetical protein